MASCKLVIKDEVNVKFEGLDLSMRKHLSNKFKYEIPYARYLPAYKLGRWDGTVSFFGLGGTTYVSMLKEVIEELENKGVYIEVDDHRNKIDFCDIIILVNHTRVKEWIFSKSVLLFWILELSLIKMDLKLIFLNINE